MDAICKAKRISDGQYELVCGDTKVLATRLPDLYFEIELSGQKHKGYLKDLKAKVLASAQGTTDVAAVKKPRNKAEEVEQEDLDYATRVQREINDAETREAQILRWVGAYNCETVAVGLGATRHEFTLPPGPEPVPALAACLHPRRDQYLWPRTFDAGM